MRNDRTIFYLKLASLISGAIGTALGVLGIKALIEVLPLFSPPKSLQDSINTNAWIEGEVDSDKGFKVSYI